jgi:hypothetical protein
MEQNKKRDDRNGSQQPAMAASKRFRGYKDEDEKAVRKTDVKPDKAFRRKMEMIQRICSIDHLDQDIYDRLDFAWEDDGVSIYLSVVHEMYRERLFLTPRDLQVLCLCLSELDTRLSSNVGMAISASINNGSDDEYYLHLPAEDRTVDCLLYLNIKKVRIAGDVGDEFTVMNKGIVELEGNGGKHMGRGMSSGKIIISGNVGGFLGGSETSDIVGHIDSPKERSMTGGFIEVLGNAGDSVGALMKGGSIRIHGNAGQKLGNEMLGGRVVVDGDIGSIGDVKSGAIFHKGKLIVDK